MIRVLVRTHLIFWRSDTIKKFLVNCTFLRSVMILGKCLQVLYQLVDIQGGGLLLVLLLDEILVRKLPNNLLGFIEIFLFGPRSDLIIFLGVVGSQVIFTLLLVPNFIQAEVVHRGMHGRIFIFERTFRSLF